MSSYVSAALRRLVAVRADLLCEYCLVHEDDAVFGCEVDHIISEKHGGATDAGNLAYACAFCNRAKGSDIGSIVPGTGHFVRFFNPRTDRWAEHFARVPPMGQLDFSFLIR
jgi:5-methylcytosine-specific restriction endonuclease McrA